jgi:hypothetical protein
MPMQFDDPYKIKNLRFWGVVDLVNPVNIPNSRGSKKDKKILSAWAR